MSNPFTDDTIVDTEQTVTVEDLVGEGKKYKDSNELAKAYYHAEARIEADKAEKARADAELKVLKDIVEARQQHQPAPEARQEQREERPFTPPTERKVEVPDIAELVRNEMASANETQRKANNINNAAETLNRVYGSPAKAQEAIRTKAAELGVGFEWLRNLAADSPEAMVRAMGIDPNARPTNTAGYSPEVDLGRQRTDTRNYEYYNNIRKTDIKRYNSPEIRKQMFDDAQKLGDKFYNP